MQDLNAKLYQKYTGLKKRKLLDDGTVRDRDPGINEMCQGLKEMESELRNLQKENNRLRDDLLSKERQLAETRTLLVDKERQLEETQSLLVDREQQLAEAPTISVDDACKTKEFETEISRLKLLLAEKNDTDHTTVSPAKGHQSRTIYRPLRMPLSTIVPFMMKLESWSAVEEIYASQGNGTDESSSSCVYHMLAESLVGMKFSLKNETEGFSLSVHHEASGYNFTLTWLEQPDGGEWAYKYSSLGTLEKVALEWMKVQDIRFTVTMCPVFFQRISRLIRQRR